MTHFGLDIGFAKTATATDTARGRNIAITVKDALDAKASHHIVDFFVFACVFDALVGRAGVGVIAVQIFAALAALKFIQDANALRTILGFHALDAGEEFLNAHPILAVVVIQTGYAAVEIGITHPKRAVLVYEATHADCIFEVAIGSIVAVRIYLTSSTADFQHGVTEFTSGAWILVGTSGV